jgi:hypothetical protein
MRVAIGRTVDKLPREARELLEAARHADDPAAAERSRSDDALRAVLVQSGIKDLPPLAPSSRTAHGTKLTWAQRAPLAIKLGAGALAVIAVAMLGVRAFTPGERTSSRSQPSAAPAPQLDSPATSDGLVHDAPPSRTDLPPAPVTDEKFPLLERRAPVTPARKSETRRASNTNDNLLQSELRTIAAVDALVRDARFADALKLLERTDSSSVGVLREERTALRILAQCRLGADARVRRDRERFLETWPRSVLADRVRNACGGSLTE